MDDNTLTDNDDLLLRLMDRYKPHMKPYAYRLQTWEHVLEKYNLQTGSRYRQIRTLKKKFEKLRDTLEKGDDRVEIGNLELLKKLSRESKQPASARGRLQLRQVHHPNEEDKTAESINDAKVRRDNSLKSHDPVFTNTFNEESDSSPSDSSRESSGANQPPPLDSITIGFPHSHAQSQNDTKISSLSSPSQVSIASSSYNPRLNMETAKNAAAADPAKINTPSSKDSPADEQLNAQINTRMLSNLLSQITNQQNLNKTNASSNSSPLSVPHIPAASPSNSLSLEILYSEVQHLRRSQEEFRNEMMYRLDIISGRLAENLNLLRQYEISRTLTDALPTGSHIMRDDSDDNRKRSLD